MIGRVIRGWRVDGLVRYLFGPGRHHEHSDQHVVASWDGLPSRHQPPRRGLDEFDTTALATLLADPAFAAGIPQREPDLIDGATRPQGPVWHCALRTAPGDRELTDDEWAQVAADVMDRTGIAPAGDPGGCRWVAVRHAPDHIHIAAVLVRQDTLRSVSPRRDYHRVREACLAAENRYGLTPTTPIDRTAPRSPERGETEKARRTGRGEASRVQLRHAVRTAAAAAGSLQEFFDLVREDPFTRLRVRADSAGRPIGYAVAIFVDWAGISGDLVWFGGRSLAADLSLPKLVERFATATALPPPMLEHTRLFPMGQEQRAALEDTAQLVDRTRAACQAAGRADPGIAHAVGDLLVTLAEVTGGPDNPQMVAAATRFERAARHPGRGQPEQLWPCPRSTHRVPPNRPLRTARCPQVQRRASPGLPNPRRGWARRRDRKLACPA
ncbi:relaxase/mobilization nuclease domain-containing protein [Actinokineospora sp. HUAS TT18]|uniref:relaxase/mobilization nuclease domain-containing protein n=1 Tax=Actinokineospora sp. HUAS TT18 TaxID=3447451 RepID=UPI003F51B82F